MFNSFNGPDGCMLDADICGFLPDPERKPFVVPHNSYLRIKNAANFTKRNDVELIVRTRRINVVYENGNTCFYTQGVIVGHPGHRPFLIYEDHMPEIIGVNLEHYVNMIPSDKLSFIINNYPIYLFDVIAIKIDELSYNFDKLNEYLSLINSLDISSVPETI